MHYFQGSREHRPPLGASLLVAQTTLLELSYSGLFHLLIYNGQWFYQDAAAIRGTVLKYESRVQVK